MASQPARRRIAPQPVEHAAPSLALSAAAPACTAAPVPPGESKLPPTRRMFVDILKDPVVSYKKVGV